MLVVDFLINLVIIVTTQMEFTLFVMLNCPC
jgi:hypothetical protein